MKKALKGLLNMRREGDSNPRYVSVNTLSKRARSTTLPPLHYFWIAKIEKIQGLNRTKLSHHTKNDKSYGKIDKQTNNIIHRCNKWACSQSGIDIIFIQDERDKRSKDCSYYNNRE